MNAPQSNPQNGTKFAQTLVDQTPKFDNTVFSRKLGIYRPRKKRKKERYL
jgi:hypothetical protein